MGSDLGLVLVLILPWSGIGLVLVWSRSGLGLVLVWSWSSLGLVLVWSWSGLGLVLIWCWSGLGLVWSGLVLVMSCSGVPVCDAVPSLYYRWLWLPSLLCDTVADVSRVPR